MYTRTHRAYLHVYKVILGFALVSLDHVMEVQSPICEPQKQALCIPLTIVGQSHKFVLPDVGGIHAAVESEAPYPVHTVQDSTYAR